MKEGERKVAMRQTMSTGVNHARAVGLCRLSRNVVSCPQSSPCAPPAAVNELRETTRSNAIAHVIYS